MAVIKETFLMCDKCPNRFGVDNRWRSAAQQRQAASDNGWIYSGNTDMCPSCRPKKLDGTFPKKHF